MSKNTSNLEYGLHNLSNLNFELIKKSLKKKVSRMIFTKNFEKKSQPSLNRSFVYLVIVEPQLF